MDMERNGESVRQGGKWWTPEACVQKQAKECGGRPDVVRLKCAEQNNKKNNMNRVVEHASFEEVRRRFHTENRQTFLCSRISTSGSLKS